MDLVTFSSEVADCNQLTIPPLTLPWKCEGQSTEAKKLVKIC